MSARHNQNNIYLNKFRLDNFSGLNQNNSPIFLSAFLSEKNKARKNNVFNSFYLTFGDVLIHFSILSFFLVYLHFSG